MTRIFRFGQSVHENNEREMTPLNDQTVKISVPTQESGS